MDATHDVPPSRQTMSGERVMRDGLRCVVLAAVLAIVGLTLMFRMGSAQPASPTPAGLPTCGAVSAVEPRASPVAASAASSPAGGTILQLVADVPLPGSPSRFDYQSLDGTTGRLAIAHMGDGHVIVFDTKTRQVVGSVGVSTPTGVLLVPELGRLFAAAAGSHTVAIIDATSLGLIAQTGQIGFPDGLAYAPAVKQVFVSDESGGGELVIDATSNTAVTTIDVGGDAGNTHYDPGSGCILVAVQSQNQLAVIDPTTDRLVGRFDLDADCQSPHGFLIDAPRRQAFVTCEDNALLLVVNLETMQVTATYPVGDGPDVLAFDPGWRRLYVASESGSVSVFNEQGTGLQSIGAYQAPHAHSIAVDPSTHLVYLPLESIDGKPVLRIMTPVPPGS